MNKNLILVLSALAITSSVFLTTGCSSGGGGTAAPLEQITPRPESTACLFSYETGDIAPAVIAAENLKTTYFGKKFDINKLNAILSTSGKETVRFAEQTGVKFYKTTYFTKGNPCSYANELPTAPADILDFYNKAGENVLGLYLPKGDPKFADLATHAGIMVRIDSDRWTMVHEYMHHLFSSLVQGVISDSRLQTDMFSLIQLYERALQKGDAQTAAVYLMKANSNLVEILRRFFLEEMTIETNLGDIYDAGQIKYVPEDMRANGAYYILSSAANAEGFIKDFRAKRDKVIQTLQLKGDAASLSMIEELGQSFNKEVALEAEMAPLKAKAQRYKDEHGFEPSNPHFAGFFDQHGKHIGTCSHGNKARELKELLDKASGRK